MYVDVILHQVLCVLTTQNEMCLCHTQALGLRSSPPGNKGVPDYLPCGRAGEDEWCYSAQCLYHDKKSHYFPDIPSLFDLTLGQTVGLLVTRSGELHLFLNRVHHKMIASGLPINTPLWGAVDVYGTCTKIKSETLSGGSVVAHMILESHNHLYYIAWVYMYCFIH